MEPVTIFMDVDKSILKFQPGCAMYDARAETLEQTFANILGRGGPHMCLEGGGHLKNYCKKGKRGEKRKLNTPRPATHIPAFNFRLYIVVAVVYNTSEKSCIFLS